MNVLLGDSIVWTSIAICFFTLFVLCHPTVNNVLRMWGAGPSLIIESMTL